jgi:hypothetical protein
MFISGRNKEGLSEREIQNCLWAWELLLGGKNKVKSMVSSFRGVKQ